MKLYIVMAGDDYYPARGSGDWLQVFEDEGLAEEFARDISKKREDYADVVMYDWVEVVTIDTDEPMVFYSTQF